MAKTKTLDDVKNQIAKTEKQIRQGENYVKRRLQEVNHQERKIRTRRLIERGAILESIIDNASSLTNEQVRDALASAFTTAAMKEMVAALHNSNGYAESSGTLHDGSNNN